MITIIACVARNGVIGKDGGQPFYIAADLKRFRALTKGKPVIMGRKTFEAILAKRGAPLPNRANIVVTNQDDYSAPGCFVCHSIEEALDKALDLNEDVYVIGGSQIYALAMPRADRLDLTEVQQDAEGDVRFPLFDKREWEEVSREHNDENGVKFDFVVYERTQN